MKTNITILLLFLTFLSWYISALPHYYKLAKKSGLPIHFTPVNPSNPLWLVIASLLGYSTLERFLPKFVFDRIKLTIVGWEARCYHEVNERWGAVFILVSPGCNTIFVSDPEVADAILTRRKDFGRIEIATSVFLCSFSPKFLSCTNEIIQRYWRFLGRIYYRYVHTSSLPSLKF